MRSFLALLCAIPVLLPATTSAGIVFQDHFDDGTLDPAWEVRFLDALSWDYTEAGTQLTTTDVEPSVPTGWGRARLVRTVDLTGPFTLTCPISWGSNSDEAMKTVYLRLFNASDEQIAVVGVYDAWLSQRGRMLGFVGSQQSVGPIDQLPDTGSTTLRIQRVGSTMQVLWDQGLLAEDEVLDTVAEVVLEFSASAEPQSYFGTASVDHVTLETPEVTAVSDFDPLGIAAARILRHPSPFRNVVNIRYEGPANPGTTLGIYDLRGRLVALLPATGAGSEGMTAVWSGLDGAGRPVPNGVYLITAQDGGRVSRSKVVLLR